MFGMENIILLQSMEFLFWEVGDVTASGKQNEENNNFRELYQNHMIFSPGFKFLGGTNLLKKNLATMEEKKQTI